MGDDPKNYGSTRNLVTEGDDNIPAEELTGNENEWELNKVYEEIIGL